MARVRGVLAIVAASAVGAMMTACGSGNGTTPPPTNYTLTVDSTNPSSGVAITGTAGTTPYTETGTSGTQYSLTAPTTAGGNNFSSWTGCTSTSGTGNVTCNVTLNSNMTVTANYSTPTKVTPTVTVTASSNSIVEGSAFNVTVTVTAPSGDPTPTGSVTISGAGVNSPAETLSNGSFTLDVPSGWTETPGTYTIMATYTPDAGSSSTYNTAQGASGNITVTAPPPPTTYTLTVDSTNPASGVSVTASPADVNSVSSGATPLTLTYDSGTQVQVTAPATSGSATFNSWTGCGSTSGTGGVTCSVTVGSNMTVTAAYTTTTGLVTPTVTVSPSSGSVNTEEALAVTVTVSAPAGSGDPTPTGSVALSNGNGYTSPATTLSSGSTVITVPAGSLQQGLNTLTATYTPNSSSNTIYTSATGSHGVTVNTVTPTVTVTPQSSTIDDQQSLSVTVAVSAPSGDPVPTGAVVLSYGSTWSSSSTTLASGSATINVPAGTLPNGSDTLTATYTPDSTSSGIYGTATGTSGAVTVGAATTVTVDQSSVGPATTDKILGVNLESWYDVVANANDGVLTGLQTAGMQSLRWPGGSWSDQYHWNNGGTPYMCTCSSATSCTANDTSGWGGNADEAFGSFETNIAKAGSGFDLALTADYGTNESCNGGGDPAEAASWAAAAVTDGHPVSHVTIGNEEYGSWETDLHASAHDPTTYADAVIGTSGYYDSIKSAITNAGGNPADTLVGVVVDADCGSGSGCTGGWDTTMLPLAKGYYDFVEYHYYPEYQNGYDSALITTYVQNFTTNINTIKSELQTAGEPNTPIYVGEISSNSANGGTQNWSITQALYAGQILGEAMNDGVSRLTWWDGYGNCSGTSGLPPDNSTLYGWQGWGAQNIFGTGSTDVSAGCNDGSIGNLSPTALAFQLFSNVAVTGENVLTASVNGDTSDVRAYAATHSGGTALVLFNLNKTTPESVNLALSTETQTNDLTVMMYDKEMYDYTNVNCQADQTGMANGNNCTYDPNHNYSTVDWVQQPVTTDLGAQSLPYTLVLQPWSINVVIIK